MLRQDPNLGEVLVSNPGDFLERKSQGVDHGVHYSPPSASGLEPSHAATLPYQGKTLTQKQKKSAGKNQSLLDGFYLSETGEEFFIKVPKDKRELFTELLAGKILTALKKAGLIDPQYHDLLICADLIRLPDGTYGLIQPKRKFTEIWKYFKGRTASQSSNGILTSIWNNFTTTLSGTGDDRNVLDEMFYGQTHYYPLLAELGGRDSLAASILYSIIIGDYSVHSANVVYFGPEDLGRQPQKQDLSDSIELVEKIPSVFGRIDWGAAWRNYGHPRNQDVLNPMEYQGYKGYTKGYHRFYTQVPGLFKAVSVQAAALAQKFGGGFLTKLVATAMSEIPADLLTQEERDETADYIGLEQFKATGSGTAKANLDFSRELATHMSNRIANLANLPTLAPELVQDASSPQAIKVLPGPDRLNPNKMFDFAFTKLNTARAEYREEVLVEVLKPSAESTAYGARFVSNGQSVVLTSAASDDKTINSRNVGTSPLPEVLKKIRALQQQNPNETYLVPLAECQHMLSGLTYRQHWTMLMIQGNECYFFDPCSNSWWPSELSASSAYSLEPLKGILQETGFRLKDENITYLGWQKDNVNCGRFSADIAGKAAELLFAKKDVDTVKMNLQGLPNKPQAEELVLESAHCMADRRIIGCQVICDQRGQEFMKNKMSRRQLMREGKDSTNRGLSLAVEREFFEYGAGDLEQVKVDVSRRKNLYFQGKKIPVDTEFTVSLLMKLLTCDENTATKIIAAHSQGPMAFLPFALSKGIKEDAQQILAIGQPGDNDLRIDLVKDQGKIKMNLRYEKFPLLLKGDGSTVGYMEGPVLVSYQLKEKAGKWGWELEGVETQNADILRILNSHLLSEEYLRDHYCPLPEVQIIRHSPSMTALIQSGYLPERAEESEVTPSPTPIININPVNATVVTVQRAPISNPLVVEANALSLSRPVLTPSTSSVSDSAKSAAEQREKEQAELTQRLKLEIEHLVRLNAGQHRELELARRNMHTEQMEYVQRVAQLEAWLKEAGEPAQQQKEQLEKMSAERIQLIQQNKRQQRELEQSKLQISSEQSKQAERISQLELLLSQSAKQLQQHEEQLQRIVLERSKLSEENARLKQGLELSKTQMSTTQSMQALKNSDAEQRATKLAEQSRNQELEIETLRTQLRQANDKQKQAADLSRQLHEQAVLNSETAQRTIKDQQTALSVLVQQKEQLERDKKRQAEEISRLSSKSESSVQQVRAAAEQREKALVEERDRLRVQAAAEQERAAEFARRLNEQEVLNREAAQRFNEQQARLSELAQQKEQLERDKEPQAQEINRLASRNLELKEEVGHLESANADLRVLNAEHVMSSRQFNRENIALTQAQVALRAESSLLARTNQNLTRQLAAVQKTSKWKFALAGIGLVLGVAALLTGVGALVGIPLLASIGTWVAATMVAAGTVAVVSGGVYARSVVCHDQQVKQAIDSAAVNVAPDIEQGLQSPSVPQGMHRPQASVRGSVVSNGVFALSPSPLSPVVPAGNDLDFDDDSPRNSRNCCF